jgi:hypothetical protein
MINPANKRFTEICPPGSLSTAGCRIQEETLCSDGWRIGSSCQGELVEGVLNDSVSISDANIPTIPTWLIIAGVGIALFALSRK